MERCQKNVIKSKASTDKFIKIERTLCVWLHLTRELAAKLTEGENIEFQGLSPTSSFYHCVGACIARQFVSKATRKAFPSGEGGTAKP